MNSGSLNNQNVTGFLGSLTNFFNPLNNNTLPYFNKVNSPDDIDTAFSQGRNFTKFVLEIFFQIDELGVAADKVLQIIESPSYNRRNFSAVLPLLPSGAYLFNQIAFNGTSGSYSIQYTVQNGLQNTGFQMLSTMFPDSVFRLYFINAVHDAILKTLLGLAPNSSLHLLQTSIKSMPYVLVLKLDIATTLSSFMFPLALSFLLPVFVHHFVMEKEGRLREFMKIMGMKTSYYWAITFFFDYVLFCLIITLFIIGGAAWQLRFFMTIDPVVYLLLFALWGTALIAFSFMISSLFNRTRPATVVSYLLVLVSGISGTVMNNQRMKKSL